VLRIAVKAEGQLLKMAALAEQVQGLQSAVEDKDSLITRMRSEQQVSIVCILRSCSYVQHHVQT
jgi:hypothetical protein